MHLKGMKPHLTTIFLVLVSAGLLTFSFPPFKAYYLVWVALVPLLLALEGGQGFRRGFLVGILFGLAHVSSTMYWVYISVHRYGGLPVWAAVSLTFSLIFYISLYWGLLGGAFSLLKRLKQEWLFPFVMVLMEYVKGIPLIRFPWGGMEMALPPHLPMSQIVDIVGIYGLGFLITVVNYLVCRAILELREKETLLIVREVFLIVLVFVGCQAYGTARVSQVGREMRDWKKIRVCVVQPDIDQSVKWSPAWRVKGLDRYLAFTRRAVAGFRPDLVIWPEAAMTFFLNERPGLTKRIMKLVREGHFDLIFGVTSYDLEGRKAIFHNSAYLVSSYGEFVGRYDKVRLVPFGEYVPLRRLLPFIKNIVGAEEDFTPGKSFTPLPSKVGRLGVTICFEGIFPEISRALIDKGAVLLLNLTNDAWFGRSAGPFQHLRLTAYRAVEDRTYLVRSTGTGISAIVAPTGRVLTRIPLETEGFLRAVVGLRRGSLTIYARHGDFFVVFCALMVLLVGGWAVLKKKRS